MREVSQGRGPGDRSCAPGPRSSEGPGEAPAPPGAPETQTPLAPCQQSQRKKETVLIKPK